MQRPPDRRRSAFAENRPPDPRQPQDRTQPRLNRRQPLRRQVAEFPREASRGRVFRPQFVRQLADVDLHRARRRAEPVPGAGREPRNRVFPLQLRQARRVGAVPFESRDFPPNDDALSRRQRQAASKAVRFAKAAFDALVDRRTRRREGFEVADETVRVVVENNAGIQHIFRVEQLLNRPHRRERLGAPFAFDERRHIPPGSVFRFERTVETVDDEFDDFEH